MSIMLGTIVNALAIIAGSTIGLLFKGGIGQSYKDTIVNAVALVVFLIGVMNAVKTEELLLMIGCLAIGSILGEWLKIEDRLGSLGTILENRFAKSSGNIAKGFVTASLLFCVGSMAIVGSIESGLTGNHETLFAKSILDGIMAIFFASTLGVGVAFSALAVFVYQGVLTVGATFLKPFLTVDCIREISAIGGVMIMALGINMLGLKTIKVGNMLPALFLPLVYYAIRLMIT